MVSDSHGDACCCSAYKKVVKVADRDFFTSIRSTPVRVSAGSVYNLTDSLAALPVQERGAVHKRVGNGKLVRFCPRSFSPLFYALLHHNLLEAERNSFLCASGFQFSEL